MKITLVRFVLALSLTLMFAGIIVLMVNPPTMRLAKRSEIIPYTAFELVLPGWHSRSVSLDAGGRGLSVSLPGTKVFEIPIRSPNIENCRAEDLKLVVYGEGVLNIEKGKYLRITLSVKRGGRIYEIDSVYVPTDISSHVLPTETLTSKTITLRHGSEIEGIVMISQVRRYDIVGRNRVLYVELEQYYPDEYTISIETRPQSIPLTSTAIILVVSGNATAGLDIYVGAKFVCSYQYYVSRATYTPRTYKWPITFYDQYFDPGNLVLSIILINSGLALAIYACYLALSTRSQQSRAP